MSRKYALVIGNTEYNDSGLARLSAPGKDANDFAQLLKDKEVGAFDDVKVLVNDSSSSVLIAIDEFFDEKKPDDLLLLYFSGHGLKDEIGSLYLAFKNTLRSRLRSTAIKSDYIHEAMSHSRSERQVLILDCCNSGAFSEGTKSAEQLGATMGMARAFQGYGRYILMASDSTQFAWEGDKVIGKTSNSLFTHFLIKGLDGEADSDNDGRITMEELYKYTFNEISKVTPKQTPKRSSDVVGEIVLCEKMRIEKIKPVSLPDYLLEEMDDTRPVIRESVVLKLDKILHGKNIGMARSAREALEKIINDENTTKRVEQIARNALESTILVKETIRPTAEVNQVTLPSKLKEFISHLPTVWSNLQSIIKVFTKKNPNIIKLGVGLIISSIIIWAAFFFRIVIVVGYFNTFAPGTVGFNNNNFDILEGKVYSNVDVKGDVKYANWYYKTPIWENTYIFIWKSSASVNGKVFIPDYLLNIDSTYRVEIYPETGDPILKEFKYE